MCYPFSDVMAHSTLLLFMFQKEPRSTRFILTCGLRKVAAKAVDRRCFVTLLQGSSLLLKYGGGGEYKGLSMGDMNTCLR